MTYESDLDDWADRLIGPPPAGVRDWSTPFTANQARSLRSRPGARPCVTQRVRAYVLPLLRLLAAGHVTAADMSEIGRLTEGYIQKILYDMAGRGLVMSTIINGGAGSGRGFHGYRWSLTDAGRDALGDA